LVSYRNGVKIDTMTHIYTAAHFTRIGADTSIKIGVVRLVVWAQNLPFA